MPLLAVHDEALRDELRAALSGAGLDDWTVLSPLEASAAGEQPTLADRPSVGPALRKKIRHDVRTPLAILLGQADLLELEPLSPRQQRCVDTLRAQCDRLERLLTEIAGDIAP